MKLKQTLLLASALSCAAIALVGVINGRKEDERILISEVSEPSDKVVEIKPEI